MHTIVFDMDGTLIDSNDLVLSIYAELIKKYPPIIAFDSLDLGDVFASSYPEVLVKLYGTANQIHLDEIITLHAMLKHKHLKLYPGVADMLAYLKRKGYKIGLLTSELREFACDELKILGIYSFFDHILAFDDLKNPKPHPDGLFLHMDYFKCNHEDMIYVGDQRSDGITAQKAHVFSVLMDWKKNKPLNYQQLFDHVVNDATALLELIDNKETMTLLMPKNRPLKILQLTDLHLMDDEKDLQTHQLIKDMVHHVDPDFIVFTGDQTMSDEGLKLYKKLGIWMDELKIPYTFVFGNHDTEGNNSYHNLIDMIESSKMLMFDAGPTYLGYSNHVILVKNEKGITVGSLIMLDSHIDDMYAIDGKKVWGYGVINPDQITWYKRIIERHAYPHLIFYHIPIPELKETTPDDTIHEGDYYESPSTPPVNTNFFEVAQKTGLAKGMFFGHDHLNSYIYKKEGMVLAYGRVSGHYDYAMPGFPKGARVIEFDQNGYLNTYVILHESIKKS